MIASSIVRRTLSSLGVSEEPMIFLLITFVVCDPPGELECFSLASFFHVPLGILDLTLWVEGPREKEVGEGNPGVLGLGVGVGGGCGSTGQWKMGYLGWALVVLTGIRVMWAESGMGGIKGAGLNGTP